MKLRIGNVFATYVFLFCMFITLPAKALFCGQPLGVARRGNDVLPDSRMKASSENQSHPASRGRLNDSGWVPRSTGKDPYPYLQINLDNLYLVCGMKVQGCSDFPGKPAWVTRYRVHVSPEENFWDSWNYLKPEFFGGKSAKEIVYSKARERKVGQYVKIFPVSFNNRPCMKVEVYGESYISDKVPVLVLKSTSFLSYFKGKVVEVNGSNVTVGTDVYSLRPHYTKVVPMLKPLKTELKVDACVLVPYGKNHGNKYTSGRIDEVKDNSYVIEWLINVKDNARKMKHVKIHNMSEMVLVYSAWCKKIAYSRKTFGYLCLGTIVRVDSEIVFQDRDLRGMKHFSYKMENRPPVSNYLNSQTVLPSEVTPGNTLLYYDTSSRCFLKGNVTSVDKQHNIYTIYSSNKEELNKTGSEVRYPGGHGLDKCGKNEKHCRDSRIPFKVNRRRCPNLQTWDGKNCTDEDECNNSFAACGLHAICQNTLGFYNCSCPGGFSPEKEDCQDIDECKRKVCHKDAICRNTPGNFSCSCKEGYKGDGYKKCVDIDECKIVAKKRNCENHSNAMCRNTPGSFRCECKPGYHGPGENCKDLNECTSNKHKCSPHANCTNTVGSYKCKCKKGFHGDGRNCKDIEECKERVKRDKCRNGKCVDIPGGYECRCNEGYYRDGIKSCKNINECTTGTHECAKYTVCTDNNGSYSCDCRAGFRGDPRKKCSDVDECKLFNCGYGQNCTNIPGSYACSCLKGFRPGVKAGSCEDINECTTIASPCGTYNYLSCENEPGTYSCRCKMGYAFNIAQRKCQDINECKKKNTCAKNAKCSNTEGSFSCVCAEGYSGEGRYFCDANSSSESEDINAWNLVLAVLIVPVLLLC